MFKPNKLDEAIRLSGKSRRQVAIEMGMHDVTFFRKFHDDGRFTREEIDLMIDILKLKNPCDIFFAR